MGSQPLSARRTRHYEKVTGLRLDRVLSHGGAGHWFSFRTPEHIHGSFRVHPLEVIWDTHTHSVFHWATCRERFPDDFDKEPPYRYTGLAFLRRVE